jgi:hypothetical protein
MAASLAGPADSAELPGLGCGRARRRSRGSPDLASPAQAHGQDQQAHRARAADGRRIGNGAHGRSHLRKANVSARAPETPPWDEDQASASARSAPATLLHRWEGRSDAVAIEFHAQQWPREGSTQAALASVRLLSGVRSGAVARACACRPRRAWPRRRTRARCVTTAGVSGAAERRRIGTASATDTSRRGV